MTDDIENSTIDLDDISIHSTLITCWRRRFRTNKTINLSCIMKSKD